MKHILFSLIILFSTAAIAQTTGGVFNASKAQAFNKSATSNGAHPLDYKAMYHDTIHFVDRPYISISEANSFLPSVQRVIGLQVIINTGGSVNGTTGLLTGGTNDTYYYKDGIADGNLVQLNIIPNLSQVLTSGSSIGSSTRTIKGNGSNDLDFDSLHNYEIRYMNRVKMYADGGQASMFLLPTLIQLKGGDSVNIANPTGVFSVMPPTALYGSLKLIGLGAAQSDTIANKPIAITSNGTIVQMDGWHGGSSGGGGGPAGSSKQVQNNNSGSFGVVPNFTADPSTHLVNADSITAHKIRPDSFVISPGFYIPDSIWFAGTSITFGVGPTSQQYRWTTLLAARLHAIESNHGCSGCTLHNQGLASIPTFPNFRLGYYRFWILEWGVNDIQLGIGDSTSFVADYLKYIDSLVAHGAVTSQILILSPSYIDPVLSDSATLLRQKKFRGATQAVATARGCKWLNIYDIEVAHGGDSMLVDPIHPNNYGSVTVYVNPIAAFLGDSSRNQSPYSEVVNGKSSFQKIQYNNNDTADAHTIVVGKSSSGQFVNYDQAAIIMDSRFAAIMQPSNIWNSKIRVGTADQSGVEAIKATGVIAADGLSAGGGMPSGLTGNWAHMNLISNQGWLWAYNHTGGLGLDFVINPLGGPRLLVNSITAHGAAALQVTGTVYISQVDSAAAPPLSSGYTLFWDSATQTIKRYHPSSSGGGGGGGSLDDALSIGHTSQITPIIQTSSVGTDYNIISGNYTGSANYGASIGGSWSGSISANYLFASLRYAGVDKKIFQAGSDSLFNFLFYPNSQVGYGNLLPSGVMSPRGTLDINSSGATNIWIQGSGATAGMYNTYISHYQGFSAVNNWLQLAVNVGDANPANNIPFLTGFGDGSIKIAYPGSGFATDSIMTIASDGTIHRRPVSAFGGGSTNSNVGSAYRLAIPGTNNIKTLSYGPWLIPDSSTSNQQKVSADTSTIVARIRQIITDSLTALMVSSGTYIPTLTNGSNVASSTASNCHWVRIGNQIEITGLISVAATLTATNTVIDISLPVATGMSATTDLSGLMTSNAIAGLSGGIEGNLSSDIARLTYTAVGTGSDKLFIHLIYTYQAP